MPEVFIQDWKISTIFWNPNLLLSATIHFHEKSHLSGSEKGRLGLLEMYFHEWVFCEMAQFEENFDFWT